MLRAVMAFLACFAMGLGAAQQLERRTKALRGWHSVLESMGAQCTCLRLSPKEMLRNALGDSKAAPDKYLLTREERQLIEACMQTLYEGTQEQQERQFKYALLRFEQLLFKAEEKQERDAKLFGTLGLLGGLCIFLLCI